MGFWSFCASSAALVCSSSSFCVVSARILVEAPQRADEGEHGEDYCQAMLQHA